MKKQILLFLFLPIIGFCQSIHYQYDCNFEDSCSIIQLDTSSNNIWQIGTPNKIIFDSSYSSSKALVTDSLNYYPINNYSKFEIHLADTPNEVNIDFKYKLDSDSLRDGFYIDLLYDTTIGWISAADTFPGVHYHPLVYSFMENLYSLNDTLYNGSIGMSGSSNGWKEASIKLAINYPIKQYNELIDTLIFRFNFISDSVETNHEGMMIDDIRVIAPILGNIDEVEDLYFTAFPNPVDDILTLELDKQVNEIVQLKIIDCLGRELVYDEIINEKKEINTEDWKRGVYFVSLYSNSQLLTTQKIIKQ